jgi:hypothetical protein
MPDINIGSKFDAKGFKQAETATDKLGKQAKKLAGALGLAFGGQQILAFGKNAVKAFAENEKSAKRLETVLKNLGLSFDTQTIEKNLGDISAKFGYEGEVLREAFQKLVTATGSTTKAQDLLNLSLDVAAGSGQDLLTVNQDLAALFVGNTKGLRKYNLGLSQTELKTLDFNKAVQLLSKTFAGAGAAELETYSGKMRVLKEAADNAQEIIGTGLVDAISKLGNDDSVDNLAVQMESVALYVADTIRGIGVMIGYIKTASEAISKVPGLSKIMDLVSKSNPILESLRLLNKLGSEARETAAQTGTTASALAHLAELQAKYAAATLGAKRKLTAEELKALKAAKLKAALEKANLALNKGQEIFDMDKIQNAAALANQAEQLAKSTTDTQRLQIANDTARLNVKQSISNLEDAIAAKDEAAIVAATNKLNADLKILGALTGQNVKLADIKSILEGLKPAELIDQKNLDEALRKIKEMMDLLAQANTASKAKVPTSGSMGSGIPAGDYIPRISKELATKGSISAILEYADAATARATAFSELLEAQNIADELALNEYLKLLTGSSSASTSSISSTVPIATAAAVQSGNRYAAQAAAQYNVTINAGVGSDPNAIAEAIDEVLRQARDRGTLTAA